MFHRTPLRPLRPSLDNPVGSTTRFSGRYPIKVHALIETNMAIMYSLWWKPCTIKTCGVAHESGH